MSHDDYQREFELALRNDRFPRRIEAGLVDGQLKFRALFMPCPAGDFPFASRHGLDDAQFERSDREFARQGYQRLFQQRLEVGTCAYNQATWTR